MSFIIIDPADSKGAPFIYKITFVTITDNDNNFHGYSLKLILLSLFCYMSECVLLNFISLQPKNSS